jgi:ATP-dependent 26S proteasome regulatory subunit
MELKVEKPVRPVFGEQDGETWEQFETRQDRYLQKQIDYHLAEYRRSRDKKPKVEQPVKPIFGEQAGETWEQFEARRDEYLQEQIEYHLAEDRRARDKEPKVERPIKPQFGDLDGETWLQFETRQDEYLQKMIDYRLAEDRRIREHERVKAKTDAANKRIEESWHERVETAKSRHADFAEVAFTKDLPISPVMDGFILDSDIGPEILYYLAQHLDDGKAIAAMLPYKAARALVLIEKFLEHEYEQLSARPETPPEASIQTCQEPRQKLGLSRVAGMADLKDQLIHDVIGPFKDPDVYRRYRVSLPNGILFYGPPGCGKTYVARSLAEELGWHFQYCRPSDVASPYIHDTVSKIRAVFAAALEKAPSIVFIDEFEAFVPARSELGGHQQYKAEEVNEFLANLEGCAERNVLVIAATNEPEKIDPAVRRSGRFDKLILIPPPDAEARRAMLEFHLRDRPVEASVDTAGLAAVLEGYAASELKFLVDEAARMALKQLEPISTATLLAALERVPASITEADIQRYSAFRSRGT